MRPINPLASATGGQAGRRRATAVHNGLLILAYALLALVGATGHLPAQVAALLWWTLPLAVWQIGNGWLQVHMAGGILALLPAGGMVLIGLYGLLAGLGYWF